MNLLDSQLFGKWTKPFYVIGITVALAIGLGGIAYSKKAHAEDVQLEQPSGTARFDVVDANGKSSCVIVNTKDDQSTWEKVANYATQQGCKVRAYIHNIKLDHDAKEKSELDGSVETTVTPLEPAPAVQPLNNKPAVVQSK